MFVYMVLRQYPYLQCERAVGPFATRDEARAHLREHTDTALYTPIVALEAP